MSTFLRCSAASSKAKSKLSENALRLTTSTLLSTCPFSFLSLIEDKNDYLQTWVISNPGELPGNQTVSSFRLKITFIPSHRMPAVLFHVFSIFSSEILAHDLLFLVHLRLSRRPHINCHGIETRMPKEIFDIR